MGLRCIFGHDFGDPRTETDREERGGELVVTETEVRECQRCGTEEVVSESTEVTTLNETQSAPAEGAPTAGSDTAPGGDATAGGDTPATGGPGEAPSESSTTADAGSSAETDATTASADTGRQTEDVDVVIDDAEDTEQVEDDAEIIEEGPTDAGTDTSRDRREWPSEDTTHPAEANGSRPDSPTGNWPDPKGTDDGIDAEAVAVEAAESAQPADPEPDVDPGAVADEDVEFVDSVPDAEPAATNGHHEGGGQTTSQPVEEFAGDSREVSQRVDLSAPERETKREYFCPDCGHAETVGASSMRKGDICPECYRGYIDERPLE